jgi:hypothetical protein
VKLIKTLGLCLASILALGMALAGVASATVPLWLLCLEGKEGSLPTKYTTNQCTTAATSNDGKWEPVSIGTKSDTVKAVALSLRLEDAKGELGAAVVMKCTEVRGGSGLIEGNLLIVREARAPKPSTECTAEGTGIFKVCKTSSLEQVEGVDLPWKVEISASGGTYTGKIKADGAGEPGWKVKCAGVEDACLSEAGKEEEASGASGVVTAGVLLVLAKFKGAGSGECTVGGKEAGRAAGFLAVLLSSGNGLSLHET